MNVTDLAERRALEAYLPSWARDAQPTLQEDYEFARQSMSQSITGADLIDELVDVQDELASLARAGDHDAIGFVVCAIFDHYVRRLADRQVFGSPGVGSLDAKAAAFEALRGVVKKDDATRNMLVRAALLANVERF